MDIQISKRQAEQIGYRALVEFGTDERMWWRGNRQDVNLRTLSAEQLNALEALLVSKKDVHGVGIMLRDIATWREAQTDGSSAKVRTLRQLTPLLIAHISNVDGHRVFAKEGEFWLCYYVAHIEYHAARREYGHYYPAYVRMKLLWQEFAGAQEAFIDFHDHDCKGSVVDILAAAGYFCETPELRKMYVDELERFKKVVANIGVQYLCNGVAVDPDTGKHWWNRSAKRVICRNARVVIDVFSETDDGSENDDDDDDEEGGGKAEPLVSSYFWHKGEDADTAPMVERPVHPKVKVFHLGKHLRLNTHVTSLKKYKYTTNLVDKLVLDTERKALVKLLINHRDSKYVDVIGEKSGGSLVMLCGRAGTGKTLTAEVFAESEKRPLYRVQCAQLGTDAEELERELLKVLTRTERWNAVLLLDEVDVYVRKRGTDLEQNAIVGVFLRVLEYMNAVMFMTTNRADDIDDAIASRCTAKLTYRTPTFSEQCRIWRVLTSTAGMKMSEKSIARVAKRYPDLSGRDVNKLIQLAMLVIEEGKPITSKTIKFVRQFKSTED